MENLENNLRYKKIEIWKIKNKASPDVYYHLLRL